MIKIIGKIPNKVYLACSGGIDSMAALDFLRNGKKEVVCVYFDHGTTHSHEVWVELKKYLISNGIEFIYGKSNRDRRKDESLEEYWRDIRYDFLHSLPFDIITVHHLDDVVETYLFSSFHGLSKLINYRKGNVYRPFLKTKKSYFRNWCDRRSIPFWDDKSNSDVKFSRNRIRHNIIPEVLKVNPGIHKTVSKLIDAQNNNM